MAIGVVRHQTAIALACMLATCDCLAGVSTGRAPCDVLAFYFTILQPTAGETTSALEVVRSSQVITLHYEQAMLKDSLSSATQFALSLRAACVMPVSSHGTDGSMHAEIELIFSKIFGDTKEMKPEQWLEEMKRPIKAGYRLSSVHIVRIPSVEARRRSDAVKRRILTAFAEEMRKIKPEYGLLANLEVASSLGANGFNYQLGHGPEGKGESGPQSADWCQVFLSFGLITGNPMQSCVPTRTYPLQGIEVRWQARSADEALNKRVLEMLPDLLKQADALEDELREESMETSAGSAVYSKGQP